MSDNKSSIELSILTFNLYGVPIFSPQITERFSFVAQELNASDHTVIFFQEVVTYKELRILQEGLANFPYCIYKQFLLGPKGGLVIFSKLPVDESHYLKYSKKGTISTATIASRIVNSGILYAKLTDYPVLLMNTHLTPNYDHDWTHKNRFYRVNKHQIEKAAELVNSITAQGNTTIFCGDFNMSKNSTLYDYILKETKSFDVFADTDSPTYDPKRKFFVFEGAQANRMDFIFINAKPNVVTVKKKTHHFEEKVKILPKKTMYLSDHIGLSANLQFNTI